MKLIKALLVVAIAILPVFAIAEEVHINGVLQGGDGGTDDQTAAEVAVTDTGGFYTGINVETILAELAPLVNTNTEKITNATHTGDVTGSDALTIAAGAVDVAHHSATGTPSATTFYRGDNTWSTPAGAGDMLAATYDTDSDNKVDTSEGGTADAAANFVIKVGDAVGATKLSITDSADQEIGYIDSDGNFGVIGTISAGPSALPTITLKDSDLLGADQEAGKLFANATTLTDGAEVTDVTLTYMDAGTVTNAWVMDGSANVFAFNVPTTFQTGDITGTEILDDTIDSADYAADSIDDEHLNTTDQITVLFDGGGSAITTGVKMYVQVEFSATITQATMLCDQSGSIIVDVWKDTYANYPPTVADTITATAKPTISAALKAQDSTLTGWTTAITAGDVLGFNVDSAATATFCTLTLRVTR